MKTWTAVLLCAAFAVIAPLESQQTTPGSAPPGGPKPLDLSGALPVTIDRPGTYVLQRNWELGDRAGFSGTVIIVSANNVVIDFRSQRIRFSHTGLGVQITGDSVRIRNGVLAGDLDSSAIVSAGRYTVIENMSIYSRDGLQLRGAGVVVRESRIYGRVGAVNVGDDAIIERNEIHCFATCVRLVNNGRFERNRVFPSTEQVVMVRGNRNVLVDNVLDESTGEISTSFDVRGNHNSIIRNVILHSAMSETIKVEGSKNTIEGNVAPPPIEGPSAAGIRFLGNGNFFGNNRVSAVVPYDLGPTTQTDWGGNASY